MEKHKFFAWATVFCFIIVSKEYPRFCKRLG